MEIDRRNAEYWDQLCSESLWQSLGLTEETPEQLRIFDDGIFAFYPYLDKYLIPMRNGAKVLEVGFGRGWLGQRLINMGFDFYGIDVATNAVQLMRGRGAYSKMPGWNWKIREGSVLALPFLSESFDAVYSIGCLHHTGNLQLAVDEVYRVLQPGGTAIIMLYNHNSFRRKIYLPLLYAYFQVLEKCEPLGKIPGVRMFYYKRDFPHEYAKFVKWNYDSQGMEGPPHTEYVTRKQAQELFSRFSKVKICCENFDDYADPLGRRIWIKRKWLLNTFIAHRFGLDLYITAVK